MLDYNDFYNDLWGNISASLISENFVLNNKELIENITFDMYRIYEMHGNIDLTVIRRIVVSILYQLKIFKIIND